MSFKVTITDKDLGMRDLMKEIKRFEKGVEFEVGVFNDAADKAAISEYGVPAKNIPARSFMSQTMDENTGRYLDKARAIMDDFVAGRISATRANLKANAIALTIVGDMRQTVIDWPEDNAKRTIKAKGFNKGLIETGEPGNKKKRPHATPTLRDSITWRKVITKGGR